MKKFLTAALALVLLLTLAACGGREGKEDPSGSPALYGGSEVQSVVDAGAFSESLEEVDADTAFALYKLADYGLERENMYDASVIRSAVTVTSGTASAGAVSTGRRPIFSISLENSSFKNRGYAAGVGSCTRFSAGSKDSGASVTMVASQ